MSIFRILLGGITEKYFKKKRNSGLSVAVFLLTAPFPLQLFNVMTALPTEPKTHVSPGRLQPLSPFASKLSRESWLNSYLISRDDCVHFYLLRVNNKSIMPIGPIKHHLFKSTSSWGCIMVGRAESRGEEM